MRYIHFIFAFIASIVVSACTTTDIDVYVDPTDTPTHGGDLQVVGRITQYTDCDVATRSKKEGDESKVTSMGLALFPIDKENGTIGDCLYYDFKLGGSIVFIVDRKDKVFDEYANKEFAMYIFANMQDAEGFPITKDAGVGKSLESFTNCAAAASTTVKDVPANGFPMVGSLGNTLDIKGIESDGKTLILKPAQTDANVDRLPLVDGKPTDNLEIPLKSMYAKFSFTISVKPDQEIVGNKAPRFDLVSYEVNNIPATVDSNSSTNDDNAVIASSGEVTMGSYAQGATTATFDFYLPERYLKPANDKVINDVLPDALKKGTYGTDVDSDQNGYRDEDERYHQRFKGKLVDGKNATYITINGKYTDHQEDTYDVSYNIYLGGNNYDDFNIIRNTHYDNSVTIRGISASDDQSVNEDGISIDWRVEVTRSTPLVINLRRESLLDAHFEVRPLRLRLVGEPTGTSATVQILNQDGTTNDIPGWIRLEQSVTTGTNHITDSGSLSYGKRKYFTTDLVTTTLAEDGKSVTVNNLTGANQTVWIYVDENVETKSRAAIVRVSYNGVDKDYKIVQNGLYEVVGANSGKTYYIEQYEEYLYNYDAEDSYGQTKDEGMPWGLDGVQLSHIHDSFICNETNSDWTTYITNNPIKYDFYIGKHDDDNDSSDEYTKDGGTLHNYAGQEFTKEIAENPNSGIEYLTMADQAESAVEYCYNRNKRNADGTVDVVWYLPSADELEDFIVPAYSTFEEFQDNYYWTSQPAYIRNAFYYEYFNGSQSNSNRVDTYVFVTYEDNKTHARATKVAYTDGKYDYVPSGLNLTSENATFDCNSPICKDTYFNVMHGWYRWTESVWSWSDFKYHTETRTNKKTFPNDDEPGDQHYNEYIDGRNTNTRYHVELEHLDDLIQKTEDGEHGYHERTKSNRVRCVRKK